LVRPVRQAAWQLGPLGSYSSPSISPDGRRIAYDQRRADGSQSGIWIRHLETDALSELTLDPSLNQVPVWSPDGKKIAFTSNRTLFNRVFEKNADGSGQEIQVVDLDVRRQVNAWDWSRDGKYVLLRNENEV
jgi:Tol biopolymer transport system component